MQEHFDHKGFVASLTRRPGIYRMLGDDGEVLYVGKARDLKNRVASYFRGSKLAGKTLAMMNRVRSIDVTVTGSETEALLLEQNLIKSCRPVYNIQLRDDKSYPYILLTDGDRYPRLGFYRGRRRAGRFFGPYPSAQATRETLQILQKMFRVRQCEDSYFRNRSRPCLQHQIKRCTAPCVGLVSEEEYAWDVRCSAMFLEGRSDELIRELTRGMEKAAAAEDFEKAAVVRDQIAGLRRMQAEQSAATRGGDADILAAALEQPSACVHAIYVRGGRIIGSKSFHPRCRLAEEPDDVLRAFISRKYLEEDNAASIPRELIVPSALDEGGALQDALSHVAGRKVKLSMRVRGHRAKWVRMARTNALESIQRHISSRQGIRERFARLREALQLDGGVGRIECFDISHTAGEGAVASCVVFDESGAVKSDYRRFNIRDVAPGDDYAAMAQALGRRFARLSRGEAKIPDLLIVDGGKGQLTQAGKELARFDLPRVPLLGIAKGPSRRAGRERLFLSVAGDARQVALAADSPALHLLQQVRDEAHRFALTGHRQRRAKARMESDLERIPGLGPRRRQALLRHFGGRQGIGRASEAELEKVAGISRKLAESIYAHLHGGG